MYCVIEPFFKFSTFLNIFHNDAFKFHSGIIGARGMGAVSHVVVESDSACVLVVRILDVWVVI